MSRSSRASWTAGLHQESVDTAFRADVRLLDEALDSLFELLPTGMTASHIAAAFARTGAAARALSSWIKRTGDGGVPIATAVGTKLPPPVLPSAIALLAQCEPPNDHALYGFIAANAPQLDGIQRDAVLRLATWPVRSPSGLTDVLGWVAWKAFPEAVAIRQMWTRWIHHGCFDGKPRSPQELARFLVDAEREELAGRDAVEEALRSHVRGELLSGERDRVVGALDHVEAAADVGAVVLGTLLREADGVAGTAEGTAGESAMLRRPNGRSGTPSTSCARRAEGATGCVPCGRPSRWFCSHARGGGFSNRTRPLANGGDA